MDSIENLSAASYLTQSAKTEGTRRTSELQGSSTQFSLQASSNEDQAVQQSLAESTIERNQRSAATSVELVTPTGQVSSDTQLGSLISTSV